MTPTAILVLATLAAGPGVTVRVAAKPSHEISPYIYGASGVSADKAEPVRADDRPLGRQSVVAVQLEGPGRQRRVGLVLPQRQGRLVVRVRRRRTARPGLASYLTVPMLPWVAKGPEGWGFSVAKYGPQQKAESYVADRGNGLKPDGSPITGNDPRDDLHPLDARLPGRGDQGPPAPGRRPAPALRPRQRADALEPHPPRRPPRAGVVRRGLHPGPRLRPGDQGGRPEGARRRPVHLGLDRPDLLGRSTRARTATRPTPTTGPTATSRSSPGIWRR